MEIFQEKAWSCLKENEKQALFLQLSGNKSSWEAGGILKIAHYKYLEIYERATKFFKMFSDFYSIHESIFRPQGVCDEAFMSYIEGVIERRLSCKQAAQFTGDSVQLISKHRSKLITKNINRLVESKDPWDIDTLRVIREFDRWNNFRILPVMLQQPSAYKRRLNKKDKIYLKYLLTRVPEWVNNKLKEKYYYRIPCSADKKKINRWWMCLISEELYTDGYLLVPVKPSTEVLNTLSKLYIYIWDNRDDADTFGFTVFKFKDNTKEVRLGQHFWPEYREIVKKAINYNQVNNIEFGVRALDNAYNNKRKPKKKPKKKLTGVRRADPKIFEKI